MKHFLTIISLLPVFCVFDFQETFGQTDWTRYSGNPVLQAGTGWESLNVAYPFVYFDGTTYHMWYSARSDDAKWRIGYATSLNGVDWTKYAQNPVMESNQGYGAWDSTGLQAGPVIAVNDTLMMWYIGFDDSTFRSGLATSTDGINWTRYNNPQTNNNLYAETDPVLSGGSAGSWEDGGAVIASVIFDGEIFHGWYVGEDDTTMRIGYANSADGINWTKFESNPIFDVGPEGSLDELMIFFAQIVLKGETYHMLYEGWNQAVVNQIGYAYSSDGLE